MLDRRFLWYEAWRHLLSATYHFAFSLRTQGTRFVPQTGPALLVANHQSFLDPTLVGVVARRHLHYLARKTLYRNRLLGRFLFSVNAHPVDQEGFAREGLMTVINLLKEGHAVLIFPEGERSWKGPMQPLRPGVHLLIKRAPCPIIPVGLAGPYESWPRTQKLPVLAPVFWPANPGCMAVAAGPPLDGRELADKPREEVLATLFAAIRDAQIRAEKLQRQR